MHILYEMKDLYMSVFSQSSSLSFFRKREKDNQQNPGNDGDTNDKIK